MRRRFRCFFLVVVFLALVLSLPFFMRLELFFFFDPSDSLDDVSLDVSLEVAVELSLLLLDELDDDDDELSLSDELDDL